MNLAGLVKTNGQKSILKLPPDRRMATVGKARKLLARSLRLERWAREAPPLRAREAETVAAEFRRHALRLLREL